MKKLKAITKIYQITFLDSDLFTGIKIKGLYEAGWISGYCFDYHYQFQSNKNLIVKSIYDVKTLREKIRALGFSRFFIAEIKAYDGLLNQPFWNWMTTIKIENMEQNITQRIDKLEKLMDEDEDALDQLNKKLMDEDEDAIDLINKEFENIVGLDSIKRDLKGYYNHLLVQKEREKRKLKSSRISLHAVFKGPPGTGKTTVARILGKIYKELEILKKGHVVEVDRGDLVAGYIGQTATKTKEKLKEATDGILFIDEAYTLFRKDNERDMGIEAIETILKFMEDKRDKIAIVVAGYENEMDNFIDSNPGIKSRFTRFYNFPHYSTTQLTEIFKLYLNNDDYSTTKYNVENYIKGFFTKYKNMSDPRSFGNGRAVRNIFNELKIIQSQRISTEKDYEVKPDKFFTKIILKDIKKLYQDYKFELPVKKG